MEKASVIIKDILQEMLVQASEQEVQAVDSNTCIRYMNRFMASLDAQGLQLGYTKINNVNDNVTIKILPKNILVYPYPEKGLDRELALEWSVNLSKKYRFSLRILFFSWWDCVR